jgi:hypothetical protein
VTDLKLPEAADLHAMARAGDMPSAFADARERLDETNETLAQIREELHDLIVEAYRLGVGPTVLARWSGYDPSRIYQILA